ncbi:hypothetical protein LUZ60_011299 [Juncus effusus]|nr:hypothetical protein LUZ60_011299 [Juncus effusus]
MALSQLNLPQISLPRIPLLNRRHIPAPPDLPLWPLPLSLSMQKVVVVMGATATGKSRLAVDLALCFNGEVVNADKMQVYAGLDVVTNKVTHEECMGVPHHLLGVLADPDADFSASEFRRQASNVTDSIACRSCLPIIAGGSNSYLEELVDGAGQAFRMKHQCCFLWVDVRLKILRSFIRARVDRMVDQGLIEEVAKMFDPHADYKRGIRRAIGVPEMDRYLRSEGILNNRQRAKLLETAVEEIKENTFKLACRQLGKIRRLHMLPGWHVHRIDATDVFLNQGKASEKAWQNLVATPSTNIIKEFMRGETEQEKHVKDCITKTATNKTMVFVGHDPAVVTAAAVS